MPEAALDENDRPKLPQHQVWSAWQCFYMQSESEPGCMKRGADAKLWFGVTSSDSRHHSGTGCVVYDIRHVTPDVGD